MLAGCWFRRGARGASESEKYEGSSESGKEGSKEQEEGLKLVAGWRCSRDVLGRTLKVRIGCCGVELRREGDEGMNKGGL